MGNKNSGEREVIMETLIMTKADIRDGKYIGGSIVFDGHVEIDDNLGMIEFESIKARGYIHAGAGTGIKTSSGSIKSGGGIEVGLGIKVGGELS